MTAYTSVVYSRLKWRQLGGNSETPLDLDGVTVNIALMNATYGAYSLATKHGHVYWGDANVSTNEVGASGTYAAGGSALASKTLTQVTTTDTNDTIMFDAADPTAWTGATISAQGALVYYATGVAGTSLLIAYLDFGDTIVSTAGTFTLTLGANGIFRWTA